MTDLPSTHLNFHAVALEEFGSRVHAVGGDQWHNPTPCREWDVRALVNHLMVEQLWVPPLLSGATVEEVGDRFDGDRLGSDPVASWDAAASAARNAFTQPGAMERTVHLSYGDRDAAGYCWEMTTDLVVHAWDLARAIGADERLDPELVDRVHTETAPHADRLHRTGLFDPPAPTPDDADQQTKMLALFGRRA